MSEAGLPFDVSWVERRVPAHHAIGTLLAWAHRFHALGWTPSYGPGDHGNMSVRSAEGCLITATRSSKATLTVDRCVEVLRWERRRGRPRLWCRGHAPPSTDAVLHYELYRRYRTLGAILHGHDPQTLRRAARLGLPAVAGSSAMALLPQVLPLAGHAAYLLIAGHGFLALGPTLGSAGAVALAMHRKSLTAGESS
jgi:ribulose-5-phosphate 4-epimerase/fuculose-1-phosphate aldolase